MKKKKYISLFLLIGATAFSQQKFEDVNQLWGGYYNSIKLSERFAINTDIQGRTTDWYKQWSQVLWRTGVSFKPNEKITVAGGFADFLFFQKGNKVSKNEYRPWVELGINDKCNELKIGHRFRVEDRQFQSVVNDELIGKYSSNYRFRYRIDFQYPLWKKKDSEQTVSLQIGNEVFINAGKSIIYNYFDQNRLFIGVGYQFTKQLNAQVGYLNVFQQLPQNVTFRHIDALRLFVFHNLDFRNNDN